MTLLPAAVLAYRPILDPLPAEHAWLWLMLPLVVVICVVYKAVKLSDLKRLPGQSLFLLLQIVLFIGGIALVIELLMWWL